MAGKNGGRLLKSKKELKLEEYRNASQALNDTLNSNISLSLTFVERINKIFPYL